MGFLIAKKLVKVFDKDKNGCIDFAEYITLHKFIKAMQNVFNQTDRVFFVFLTFNHRFANMEQNRSGTLDSSEIAEALTGAGFSLNLQSVAALFHRQNKTNTGVDFPHFLEMAADIALVSPSLAVSLINLLIFINV